MVLYEHFRLPHTNKIQTACLFMSLTNYWNILVVCRHATPTIVPFILTNPNGSHIIIDADGRLTDCILMRWNYGLHSIFVSNRYSGQERMKKKTPQILILFGKKASTYDYCSNSSNSRKELLFLYVTRA